MKLFGALVVFSLVLTGLVGCGGKGYNSNSNTNTDINVAGTWTLSFTSSGTGGAGTATGAIAQTGETISDPNMTLSGNQFACATTGMLNGSISKKNVTATLTDGTQTKDLTGTGSSDGTMASGTYTGGCLSSDTGTWTGTKTATPSGAFIGSLQPSAGASVGLVLNLTADGNILSGSASFTNSTCLNSVSIEGTISGLSIQLAGASSNASLDLRGSMDPAGKSLTLDSHLSGACNSESGSGTLVKIQ